MIHASFCDTNNLSSTTIWVQKFIIFMVNTCLQEQEYSSNEIGKIYEYFISNLSQFSHWSWSTVSSITNPFLCTFEKISWTILKGKNKTVAINCLNLFSIYLALINSWIIKKKSINFIWLLTSRWTKIRRDTSTR